MKMSSRGSFVGSQSTKLLLLGLVGAGVLVVCNFSNGSAVAANADACKASATDAAKACTASAKSDVALALGKCANIADPVARKACQEQAKADLKDALDTCKAQSTARLAVCTRLGGATYEPSIVPSNFVGTINNPFNPLVPGTTFTYVSALESNPVFVTHNTKVIEGVTCVEVHDTVYMDGVKTEDTLDWYAQDKDGNVWYFGEDTTKFTGPKAGKAGSFSAGVDGALPGIIMLGTPRVGDQYRQEYYKGHAEDIAEVLTSTGSETVPYGGAYKDLLVTKDVNPLDPAAAIENKYFAKGIGFIAVKHVTGPAERLELVKIEKF